MDYSDAYLRRILRRTKVIACVGVSPNDVRPSYYVVRYLHQRGFRTIPVNPAHAGKSLFGEVIRADLSEIPEAESVDMVDVFRRAEAVPDVWADARAHLPNLRTFWMQIGVRNAGVAAEAEAAGIDVIQDRCPKLEHQRLFGELRKAGINTRVISSRLT